MMKSFRMKAKAIALVVALTVAAPVTVPFTGNIVVAEAATVKISNSKVTMELAATTTLKISGTKSKVTWKTSNKTVATVSSKGVVTAQSAGTAKITATVNKKNYTCTVTVNAGANPYQVNANQQEVQMAGLSFVVPSIYELSDSQETNGSYTVKMKLPDSKSSITVIAKITEKPAYSYEDVVASFEGVDEKYLQENYDAAYGAGVLEVSDFNTFSYDSENGTKSYAYSFMLTSAIASGRTISYNLSIDGYSIEVISVDAEGYDVYIDAEYLIDSLMYLQ